MQNKMLLIHNYIPEFTKQFHLPLHKFVDPIFGFDIVKFDEAIGTPDGTSCNDYVTEKYGKEANKLITKLLNI